MIKKVALLIIICLIGIGVEISYLSKVSNPLSVVKGVIQLQTTDEEIVQISTNPTIFLGKTSSDIVKYMESKGYHYKTQEGSVYFFDKDNRTLLLKGQMFTSKYITWRFSK